MRIELIYYFLVLGVFVTSPSKSKGIAYVLSPNMSYVV